ncbi:hypothetical protein SAMN06298212_10690 [Ruaniaceae bacterium KH17]|nr:hypothetical protein SAMN06298212_10690 [Ruaniaceae bacterium KH17]
MRLLRGFLCALVLSVGIALPAAAHDQLIASNIEDGSVLTEAPTQIELEYSAEIMDATPAIAILDESGSTVHEVTPAVDGRFVRAPFPELPDGAYQLNWSVVSSDGHRIEGTIAFELEVSTEPTTPEPTTTEPTTPEPATEETTSEPTAAPEPGEGSTLQRAIVGVAGIAAVGAIAVLLVRRWKNEDPTS